MSKQTGYMPDLAEVTLDDFKLELKTGRLLPSRQPLLENIDHNFAILEKSRYKNIADLKKVLDKKKQLQSLAATSQIDETYLTLLKREISSSLPTPVKFSSVPLIDQQIVTKLNKLSIYTTEDLFPFIKDQVSRTEFAKKSQFSPDEVLWLAKLVDVSRIKWVGPKLARLIIDTEYDTVEKLTKANPEKALLALNTAKKKNKAYDGPLGIDDISSWIKQVISRTPQIIKY